MQRDGSNSILRRAENLVYGDREAAYGDANEDLQRVAQMWSAIFDQHVEPWQVAAAMVCIKLSRLCHARSEDSWVDVAGWADVGAQVDDRGPVMRNTR